MRFCALSTYVGNYSKIYMLHELINVKIVTILYSILSTKILCTIYCISSANYGSDPDPLGPRD